MSLKQPWPTITAKNNLKSLKLCNVVFLQNERGSGGRFVPQVEA